MWHGRSSLRESLTPGYSGTNRRASAKIPRLRAELLQPGRQILQSRRQDVNDLALTLQPAVRQEHGRPRAARRHRRHTASRTIRLAVPVSSSSVTKVIPLAVPGRWRTSTMPATLTRLAVGQRFQRLRPARRFAWPTPREGTKRMPPQRQAGGAVVGQHFFGGRHGREGGMMNGE